MKLVIGNKNYSSWSMRPWMAAKAAGLPFEEEIVWLREPGVSQRIRAYSPNGKVPALIDGDLVVFESIAILEYLAERAPTLWPSDRAARSHARSISAEMHAGFVALRSRCPMSIRRRPSPIALDGAVKADIARIVEIWTDCRKRFGQAGPFLFGPFTNADAMFAPVVSRFQAYAIEVPPDAVAYMEAMIATPMWQEWRRAAVAEAQTIADTDEVA
jgi:glutathione S-transferase